MITIPYFHRNIIVIDVPDEYKEYNEFIPRFLSTLRISFMHKGTCYSWDIDEITPDYLNSDKIMFVDLLKNITNADVINGMTKTGLINLLTKNNVNTSKNLLILMK